MLFRSSSPGVPPGERASSETLPQFAAETDCATKRSSDLKRIETHLSHGPTSDFLSPTGGEDQGAGARFSEKDNASQPWTVQRLEQAIDAYYVEHERICLDPNARNLRHTYVLPSEDKLHWRVQQVLVDPEDHNDWVAEFEVDLAQSRKSGEPVLRLLRISSIGK